MSTLKDFFEMFQKVNPFLQVKPGQFFPPEPAFCEEWKSRVNKVGEQILKDSGKASFGEMAWDTPLTPAAEALFKELKTWVEKENPMLANCLKI